MADILFVNGDVSNTMYGDIAVVSSYDDITQFAINNILTIFGENEFHPEIGNMAYKRRLKVSDNSLRTIEKDCINATMQSDDRIDSVVSMNASYDDNNPNNVNIVFVIKAIDGTLMSNNITISI